jgi:hypothetical protein
MVVPDLTWRKMLRQDTDFPLRPERSPRLTEQHKPVRTDMWLRAAPCTREDS